MEVKVIGQMDNTIDHTFESANRVYDKNGLSPTINTCGGGGLQPKIIQKDNLVMETVIIDDTYANRKPRLYEDYSPALRSEREGLKTVEQNICRIEPQYRIRKLTPLECWQLMDFSDEDFNKAAEVNSNTQLYKQAGNSIVRNVLVAILGQMIPGKEEVYKTE